MLWGDPVWMRGNEPPGFTRVLLKAAPCVNQMTRWCFKTLLQCLFDMQMLSQVVLSCCDLALTRPYLPKQQMKESPEQKNGWLWLQMLKWHLSSFFFFLLVLFKPPPPSFPMSTGRYVGITLSVCSSVCVSVSTQYLLNCSTNFYQTWYGGVLSWGDVSCRKIGSLSSMLRSQPQLI